MAQEKTTAIEMYGSYKTEEVVLVSGIIDGGINDVPVAQIEFVSRDRMLDLSDFVGGDLGFSIAGADAKEQLFYGTCISAEYKGSPTGDGHYFAEVRPWIWFLTRSHNNRVFQNMTTTAIVQEILGDYGFSKDLVTDHSKADARREYCVQYRETDLDFIKRLLEQDGIYFYFDFGKDAAKLVLADSPSTHPAVKIDDELPFRDDAAEQQLDHIYKWTTTENVVSGKVTLDDYDFTKPKADLTSTSIVKSGKHQHNDYEVYRYPGGYRESGEGDQFASFQMEAAASQHQVWTGEANILNLWVGYTFDLIDHPRHKAADMKSFMVTRAKQYFRLTNGGEGKTPSLLEEAFDFGLSTFEHTRIVFDAVLKSKPFRMLTTATKPTISGVHTAVVTGSSGAEIETDKYGRIKVQFHWDRAGKFDDSSSCWVRTMMPWTGKGWGATAIPRVGQEVVIQFEEGDPDRPLCVGMLYNADTMPPYELPANATRSGIKTNSSSGGGGYNELMFEDKKGDELVRFEAEKDYVQTVQNSAHIRVGYEHGDDVKKADAQDDKSLKIEIENHLDEIIEKGDHSFEVTAGKQTLKVKKDKDETIQGKSTQTITDDVSQVIKDGNVSREVKSGNDTTKVSKGNYSVDTDLGKINLTAKQSITLKVGGSSIVVDTKGVTIKGPMINVEGTAMVDVKGKLTTVKADAILTLKGSMTKIN
jgi:type VI secretion system secreted protein VgrG